VEVAKKRYRDPTDVVPAAHHYLWYCQTCKGGYTLVTLQRLVTPYRDSVDGTRDRVTYQKLVTR